MLDGLLALVLLLAGVAGTAPASRNVGLTVSGWWVYVPVVLAALAIVVRRRFPLPVLGVTVAALCAYLLMGLLYGPILFSLGFALYTVAAHRTLRVSASVAGAVAVLMVACGMIGTGFGPAGVTPVTAWAVVPLAIGVIVRVTREQTLQTRRTELRSHADAERLRVAQEVHDVVGHGLAAITMQADIALHVLAKRGLSAGDPALASAADALTAISRTSRESLDELRVTLGAVRRGPDEVDDRSPVAGLVRLDALVDRTRSAGVPVSLSITGPITGLPTAVDLAAYRVVQESLTNVLRHAGSATAAVHIEHAAGHLTVTVTDTGRGSPSARASGSSSTRASGSPSARASGSPSTRAPDGGGHGLVGMRERVTALGGTLSAGPQPSGGFAVTATIPVPRTSSATAPPPAHESGAADDRG